jgi:hypothetical protein
MTFQLFTLLFELLFEQVSLHYGSTLEAFKALNPIRLHNV